MARDPRVAFCHLEGISYDLLFVNFSPENTVSRTLCNLTALIAGLTFGMASAADTKLSAAEKASRQAGMQQHIDRTLVGVAYLHLDSAKGEVAALHPFTAHPMIPRMGNYYVLCSDFHDVQGNPVNADFYMARRGKAYAVFEMSAAHRARLEPLMRDGKVEAID